MTTLQGLQALSEGRLRLVYLVKPGSFGAVVTYDPTSQEFLFTKPWRLSSPRRPSVGRTIRLNELLFQTLPLVLGPSLTT